jgi:hypothetical protein
MRIHFLILVSCLICLNAGLFAEPVYPTYNGYDVVYSGRFYEAGYQSTAMRFRINITKLNGIFPGQTIRYTSGKNSVIVTVPQINLSVMKFSQGTSFVALVSKIPVKIGATNLTALYSTGCNIYNDNSAPKCRTTIDYSNGTWIYINPIVTATPITWSDKPVTPPTTPQIQ